MLASVGVKDIFLAYNLVGPNVRRVVDFVKQFPDVMLSVTADHGTWLEINAHPGQLDLDGSDVASAKGRGIPIVINTDAHSTVSFDVIQYGIFQAHRAGLEATDVANTRTHAEFCKLLRRT